MLLPHNKIKMNKYANFTGQPIFSQLLNFIDRSLIRRQAQKHQTDHYYKKFKTYDHVVTMLYAIFHKCNSIREVTTGMQVCSNRLKHLGISYSPRRSTFSEANAKRSSRVFEGIYMELYKRYGPTLPDSLKRKSLHSRLYIVDSTTIQLFKEILKNAGKSPIYGKRKGGIKAHMMIKADQDVPCFVKLTAAAKHDLPFIQGLQLPKGSIIVFDKAYVDYMQYHLWDQAKVTWVTRLRKGAIHQIIHENPITETQYNKGIISDQNVILGHTTHNNITRIEARLIRYYDKEKQKVFTFISNSKNLAAYTISQIYKQRWQIELLFKRLKQNYPLKYFLGDNENAIRIQIWCALIADLLIKTVQTHIKTKWSFANMSSIIRIHLMTYVNLFEFLNHPDKSLIHYQTIDNKDPTLF